MRAVAVPGVERAPVNDELHKYAQQHSEDRVSSAQYRVASEPVRDGFAWLSTTARHWHVQRRTSGSVRAESGLSTPSCY